MKFKILHVLSVAHLNLLHSPHLMLIIPLFFFYISFSADFFFCFSTFWNGEINVLQNIMNVIYQRISQDLKAISIFSFCLSFYLELVYKKYTYFHYLDYIAHA